MAKHSLASDRDNFIDNSTIRYIYPHLSYFGVVLFKKFTTVDSAKSINLKNRQETEPNWKTQNSVLSAFAFTSGSSPYRFPDSIQNERNVQGVKICPKCFLLERNFIDSTRLWQKFGRPPILKTDPVMAVE